MIKELTLRLRIIITGLVTILIWAHLAWDYFHEGIPTHYILHDPDMPGIPNWLGGIVLPFFTWFLLHRIHRRIDAPNSVERLQTIKIRFISAVLVAISIALCFSKGVEVTDYIMGTLLVLALFIPVYKSEYLLGFVLGASFTFGAIIPLVFGSILAFVFFLLFKFSNAFTGFIRPKKSG